MAAYDLEEQEQIEELKVWWKQYGNTVISIVLAASIAVAAWQGWGWRQRDQSAQASAIYVQLQKAANERDAKRTRDLAGTLIEKFSGSQYAVMGALISARVQVDAADLPNARVQLQWVVDKAGDPSLRDLARVRLAGVLADEGSFAEAVKVLTGGISAEYRVRQLEILGDIAVAQGKPADAKNNYEQALATAEKNQSSSDGDVARRASAYRDLVQVKLDGIAIMPPSGSSEQK